MSHSFHLAHDRLVATRWRQPCATWLCALTLPWGAALLADEMGSGDSSLPQALTEKHFEALLEHSPFTRSLNLSDSILLTGVAEIEERSVATLFNKETRESYVVSETPNFQGWKMVEIARNGDLEQVSATISVNGGEIVTVRFDESQLKPGEGKPAAGAVPVTPRGSDNRPLPNGDERRKFGEWVKQRMSKFSDQQKRRLGQIMQEKMRANPSMSDRQKGEVFSKILDYVESNK